MRGKAKCPMTEFKLWFKMKMPSVQSSAQIVFSLFIYLFYLFIYLIIIYLLFIYHLFIDYFFIFFIFRGCKMQQTMHTI